MEKILSTTKENLSLLLNSAEPKWENIVNALDYMNELFRVNLSDESTLQEICNTMVENGFLEAFCTIWNILRTNNVNEDLRSRRGMIFQSLKEVLWNYSDRCPSLCRTCYYDGRIVNMLLQDLKLFAGYLEQLKDNNKRHHIKANFGILHNMVQHYRDNVDLIRRDRGLDVVVCYTRSEYLIVRTYAFVILAFCSKQEDHDTLLPGTHVFEFLLELLKATLSSPNHVSLEYGMCTEEVVQSLTELAATEANKKSMVDVGFLVPITDILDQDRFSSREISRVLEFFWPLMLFEYSKSALQKQPNVVAKLNSIHNSSKSTDAIKNKSASILYVLNFRGEVVRKHIMLSYQWASQDTVKKLYRYLTDLGFIVWMDLYDMQGSIYQSMAKAVEMASVVVMSVTRKYKDSENCKIEAEYARLKKVPILPLMLEAGYEPDGWLGIVMGPKLYIDLSGENPHGKFPEVKKHLVKLVPDLKSCCTG